MNASAVRQMKAGDWMVGGSRDFESEKRFGFGPQSAAQVASMAYQFAVEECSATTTREQFVAKLCGLFEEGLRDAQ